MGFALYYMLDNSKIWEYNPKNISQCTLAYEKRSCL
jgi:hypothetical protein